MLCPERRDKHGKPEEPSEFELNHIRKDKAKLKVIRSRLSDISWWMRLLSQHIAQRANKEDGELGKFWQARYRAVRLLDETAILACAAYVDLNPIRAALAEMIEETQYSFPIFIPRSAASPAREFRVHRYVGQTMGQLVQPRLKSIGLDFRFAFRWSKLP